MNEYLISNNNNNTIKSNDSPKKINSDTFNYESEMIASTIIHKIISLVFSTSFNNEVEKKICDYCYQDVINILHDIKNLEFIQHDTDDLYKKNIVLEKISKTPIKERNKYLDENLILFNDNKGEIMNKSQIFKEYKFIDDLDPNISFNYSLDISPFLPKENQILKNNIFEKENIVMNILKRKKDSKEKAIIINKSKKNKTSLIKSHNNINDYNKIKQNEQGEKIDKFESLKLESCSYIKKLNSNVTSIQEKEYFNNWDIIPQPKPSPIDRLAGTKIKYINTTCKTNLKDGIIENSDSARENNIPSSYRTRHERVKSKTTIFHARNSIRDNTQIILPKKKHARNQYDYPTYDLDPEKLNYAEETEEIINMRKQVEEELEEKRKEKIMEAKKEKEKMEKEKEISEKRKALNCKNITVDVKGNIVYVRPIQMESLINDFINMKTHSKEVEKIIDKNIPNKSFKNVKVEINKNPDFDFTEKETSSKYRRTNFQNTSKISQNNRRSRNRDMKLDKAMTPDRNDMKFASGSNFEIMNLECGVNLIEKNRKKTGGKDYFHKFGRFSYELFQNQLNKTSSGFYTQQLDNNFINININDENDNSEINMKTDKWKKGTGLPPLSPLRNKNMKKEKAEYDLRNTSSNEKNKYLNLKINNLKYALNNLDLIDENYLKENNIENKINYFKNSNAKDIKRAKKDFGEINIFNKTLMGNKFWGESRDSHKNMALAVRLPVKLEKKYLQREVNSNLLNHLPRKRLPPISSAIRLFSENANQTEYDKNNATKNKRKLKELKNKNLSKNNLYENKRKMFLSNASGFYSNTEKNFTPNRKNI